MAAEHGPGEDDPENDDERKREEDHPRAEEATREEIRERLPVVEVVDRDDTAARDDDRETLNVKEVASVPMNELTLVKPIASPFTSPRRGAGAELRDDAPGPAALTPMQVAIAATVAIEATERSKIPAMMQTVIAAVTTSSSED